jgi:hypothetical protein
VIAKVLECHAALAARGGRISNLSAGKYHARETLELILGHPLYPDGSTKINACATPGRRAWPSVAILRSLQDLSLYALFYDNASLQGKWIVNEDHILFAIAHPAILVFLLVAASWSVEYVVQ